MCNDSFHKFSGISGVSRASPTLIMTTAPVYRIIQLKATKIDVLKNIRAFQGIHMQISGTMQGVTKLMQGK